MNPWNRLQNINQYMCIRPITAALWNVYRQMNTFFELRPKAFLYDTTFEFARITMQSTIGTKYKYDVFWF